GRAGRAEKPGEVWLQTHHPEHPLLQTLLAGGYASFAEEEFVLREAAGFPPFAHLALLRAEAQDINAPTTFLQAARERIETISPNSRADDRVDLSGPLPAPMPRRAGQHRAQLLMSSPARRRLHAALEHAVPALYDLPEARRVRWSLDVDPVDLY
ncbi:MAG TPA: primosomal protein N', partial [Xanthomonadaceae bacterium]|nr:primosomal protein N' [Xanthomonadaceae bacterium]